jgi:hypothetical protein
VTVEQVKLRVWPPTGVLGGWSSTPSQPASPVLTPQMWDQGVSTFTEIFPSQADLRADLATRTTTAPTLVSSGQTLSEASMGAYYDDDDDEYAQGNPAIAYLRRNTSATFEPTGDFGVDWIYPPNEVPWDEPSVLHPAVGSPSPASWVQGQVTILLQSTTSDGVVDLPADGLFHVGASTTALGYNPSTDTGGAVAMPIVVSGAFASGGQTSPQPLDAQILFHANLPEIQDVMRVTMWHDGHLGDIAQIGASTAALKRGYLATPDATLAVLRYTYTPAPVNYWNPAAPALAPPLRLIQRKGGQGMGAGRILGVGTRQNSNRVLANP